MNNAASFLTTRPNRVLWVVIGALLVLNALLVACLLAGPKLATCASPAGGATAGAAFLVDTLRLSPAQRVRYDTLRAGYLRQVQPLAQSCRQSCQQYFSLLDSTLTDAQLRERSRAALESKIAVDVLTVRHLQQVAGLCTPAQRQVLQSLLRQGPDAGCAAPGAATDDCLPPISRQP